MVSLLGTAGWTVCFWRKNWYCMRRSQHGLQHAYFQFSAACDQEGTGTKISTKKMEAMCLYDAQSSVFCKWVEIRYSRWWRSSSLGWYSRLTEVGTKRLIHGLVKQTQFCVSFTSPWWRNGSFQNSQSFQFLNWPLLRSSPVVMNLRWRLKEYCQMNKRKRWNIWEEFTLWHFVTKSTRPKSVNLGMSSLRIEGSQLRWFGHVSRMP